MCFFSPIRNDPKKTHKQNVGTHPVPGQSRKFVYVYVYVFFLSLINAQTLRIICVFVFTEVRRGLRPSAACQKPA